MVIYSDIYWKISKEREKNYEQKVYTEEELNYSETEIYKKINQLKSERNRKYNY